jgi:hypothetical protein
MPAPVISATVIPTGGAIRLDLPNYFTTASGVTAMTISRAVSGTSGLGAFTLLFSGSPQPVYIDVGDATPGPLIASSGYVYQVTDSTGTSQIGPIVPGPSLLPQTDPLTNILIRLLQAGISNMTLPPGFIAPQITTAMPVGGLQALPFIVINLDLIQQSEVGIGQDVVNPNAGNDWTIWVNAKRVWRVSVLSQSVEERDFYRTALISIYQVILATVFDQLGVGVTRDIQAASGTDISEPTGRIPGFYFADIMFTADGVLNTTIVTGYGLIETIMTTIETGSSSLVATVSQTA